MISRRLQEVDLNPQAGTDRHHALLRDPRDLYPRKTGPGRHCSQPNTKIPDRVIEAQFTAVRYFTLDGTDHASHKERASMIRRYIIWRSNHAYDERLRRIVDRANVA